MKKSVVIPAAGSIAHKFPSLRPQFLSAALFPVNSKSLLSYSLDFYCQQSDSDIIVIANSRDEELLKKEFPHYNFRLVTVENTKSIIETLKVVFKKETQLHNDITLSVVTTIPVEMPPQNTIILSDRQELCHFYSAVAEEESEHPKFFHRGCGVDSFGYPFTGIIRSSYNKISAALAKCNTDDLLELAEHIYKTGGIHFKKCEWIDCGHEVNYTEAKAKLLSSRSFNSLRVELVSGILEKKSTSIKKFINETSYVEKLPAELQVFFPRVIEKLKTDNTHASVKMDYFSYPNIAELQLYRSLEDVQWYRIFSAFEFVLKKFHSAAYKINKQDYLDFYLGKTISREAENEKWLRACEMDILLSDNVVINDLPCKSFNSLLSETKVAIENLYSEKDFCVMHGDFCFNNILYDNLSGTIRLIDPRGSFGEKHPGIYGDCKYDLAKLLHSSVYCYDYIVNDLFHFKADNNKINYRFNLRSNHSLLTSLSNELVSKMGFTTDRISIIVALLFLSMCPLHNDNLQRQKMMYAHGLYLLNKSLIPKPAAKAREENNSYENMH
jgi:hypothetical protein